jgi:nucleoside-diphosphate-sugar epimerase
VTLANTRILITGGGGYLGSQVVARLAALPDGERPALIVSHDLREPAVRLPQVDYLACDIRSPQLAEAIALHRIDVVVHLAAIMPSGKAQTRDFEYDVDVNGTRRLLDACVQHGVKRIVVSSSGAAYGYHFDNAPWLTEDMPVRGNEVFAYSHHKRLVEEMLADLPQQPPGAGAGGAAHWHHPGPHGAQPDHRHVREAPSAGHTRLGQPVCVHLGPGRGGHHPARGIGWPGRHLQRGG